ncbi:bestrophin-2-like [Dreissena polymorpha]|uniref:Bestrophin homolog n=1 Tax=Dreissena polymorpha TaxID=45954 RepID=A0A9D4MIU2_DREPO|nr:bestrophin-2-like [Dreissena polymorpha]XP_052273852.1 bestrophin-2-like [Dreissena polymorpha]XP_052273856.1 bestrophin-2-like [Dreissena polymorpha]KAH3878105.1 hypothetical protein DPMN_001988 [Dreissena polymorpha]
MTITYQRKVATTSFFGFFRLLKAWRGSVYKLIYKETLVFCLLYTIISLIYRLGLSGDSKRTFEKLVAHCESYTNLIPVSFVLGFYVSVVVGRWWTQFTNFPWPDRTLYIMGSYVVGRDDASRIIRRTVARYMMAAQILILRSVSVSVMKRFPTMEHIVNAGFLTDDEVIDLENVNCKYHKFWVPLVWANTVITNARREGKITSDYGFQFVIQQLADYRDRLSICFVFDWITVPLVYTQVVTLAVYIFFGACLIGRQYVDNDKGNIDLYVPVFTLLQFLFYMGWLKVAEQLINPFGEDDDDFDMNWLMDRHVGAMWCLVDYCHQVVPALVKDMHFNEIVTEELPYTEASMASRRPNFMGSTYNMERPSLDHQRIVPNPELYDMNHNGSFAGLRQRSRSHVTHGDSNWSLFRDKESLQMSHSHTNLDIKSNQVPNGLPPKGPLDVSLTSLVNAGRHVRKGSIDSRTSEISYLSCAESPATEQLPEYTPLKRAEKDRKWSFPLNLLHRKSSKEDIEHAQTHPLDVNNESDDSLPLLNAIASNKGGRFQVDIVPGDHDVDASKQARNKQIIDKHMGYMAVSRAPVLSPIEEGGTVRSVKEILTSSRASSVSSLNGEVNHNGESEIPPTIVEEDGNPDDAFPLPIKTEMTSLLTCVCACADHSKPHDSVTVEMDNEGTFQGRLLVDRSERPSIPEITVDQF